jgi:hypothetical protein
VEPFLFKLVDVSKGEQFRGFTDQLASRGIKARPQEFLTLTIDSRLVFHRLLFYAGKENFLTVATF